MKLLIHGETLEKNIKQNKKKSAELLDHLSAEACTRPQGRGLIDRTLNFTINSEKLETEPVWMLSSSPVFIAWQAVKTNWLHNQSPEQFCDRFSDN